MGFSLVAIDRHVIGVRPVGFFSNFLQVINHLDWCKKTKTVPVVYWHSDFPYWQEEGFNGSFNAWEYYFDLVSSESYQSGDGVCDEFRDPDGNIEYLSNLSQAQRYRANTLITEYIKAKSYVTEKVNNFFEEHFNNCIVIGIHLRGTDKYIEVKPVDPIVILSIASMQAKKFQNNVVKFFIASDEQRLIDLAIKQLAGYEVVVYPSYRSTTGAPIHTNITINNAQRGLEVLIEALLLSRCSLFIHTTSNLSAAVMAFNPHLQAIGLDCQFLIPSRAILGPH